MTVIASVAKQSRKFDTVQYLIGISIKKIIGLKTPALGGFDVATRSGACF